MATMNKPFNNLKNYTCTDIFYFLTFKTSPNEKVLLPFISNGRQYDVKSSADTLVKTQIGIQMKNPKIKTRVVHSQTKSAWNIVGKNLGGKYKIARIPYIALQEDDLTEGNRKEAFEHAEFISYCFNQSDTICNEK